MPAALVRPLHRPRRVHAAGCDGAAAGPAQQIISRAEVRIQATFRRTIRALQHGQRERDTGETVSTGGHEPGWDSSQPAASECAEAKAGTLT